MPKYFPKLAALFIWKSLIYCLGKALFMTLVPSRIGLNTAHWLKVPWHRRGERGSTGAACPEEPKGVSSSREGSACWRDPEFVAHRYKLRECSYQKMFTELWSNTPCKEPRKSSVRKIVMLPNMAGILLLRSPYSLSRVLTIL